MSLFESYRVLRLHRVATCDAPFIAQLSDGTLPAANFDAWLVQDYVFVRAFIYFTAYLAVNTASILTPSEVETLAGGYDALRHELELFEKKAAERGITSLPKFAALPVDYKTEAARKADDVLAEVVGATKLSTKDYVEFLIKCTDPQRREYSLPVLIVVLFVLERVYLDAFTNVKKSQGFQRLDASTRAFVEWWSKDEFVAYVETLEAIAKRFYDEERLGKFEAGQKAVEDILKYEIVFWESAFE